MGGLITSIALYTMIKKLVYVTDCAEGVIGKKFNSNNN